MWEIAGDSWWFSRSSYLWKNKIVARFAAIFCCNKKFHKTRLVLFKLQKIIVTRPAYLFTLLQWQIRAVDQITNNWLNNIALTSSFFIYLYKKRSSKKQLTASQLSQRLFIFYLSLWLYPATLLVTVSTENKAMPK